MNSHPKLPEINKEAFTQAREKLGLSTKDLGGMACLSTRQIEQIESGDISSFYGVQVKLTAAKKVAKLLGLSEDEAFDLSEQTAPKAVEPESIAVQASAESSNKPKSTAKNPSAKSEQEASAFIEQPEEIVSSPSNPQIKPAKKKNALLWLSVLAAAAFAIINLSQFFFADQPQEIVIVKEEVKAVPQALSPAPPEAPPATPPVTSSAPIDASSPTAVLASEIPTACPAEDAMIRFKPEAPRKAADMVYLQVKSKQVVCVIDASGKTQNKLLEPGIGASFYGKPPFKVLTAGLGEVDVFFQGAKVRLANPGGKTLSLEAAEVILPSADPTDSQLR